MIGQTIAQYRIIRELGRGAMGVVYLAEHVVLGRRVAIKTVSSNYGRFLREARAASALSHPHIATIHDYGKTDSGQPYIVMEYIEGKTLADFIHQGNLTIPRSLRIVREVAEALSEAHRHNIIHRDIKPTNIAVDDRGIVKVLDFGLAKQVGLEPVEPDNDNDANSLNTQTREGVLVGTPMYFSPEQAMGLELDPRSDLFSLGLVLYECLCGKPAFSGVTPMDICAKVIRDEPVPPSQINPSISTDVERVTLRALEKAKDKRYQSATQFASDLETLELSFSSAGRLSIDQTQVLPKQKPVVTDRGRKLKRLALPVLGVVIIGLISVWLLSRGQKKEPEPQPEQVRLGIGGNVIEAAISPDGKVVAYVNDENGKQSISLRQLTTGTDLVVVNPANAKYKGLSFFPDNDYLTYLKSEGDSADLYKVSTYGGPSRKLAARVDTPVGFSPDGKQFTFVRYSAAEHTTTLLIADVNGGNEQTLVTLKEPQFFSRGGFYSSGPAWSPDGKIIAVPAFSVTEKTYREISLVNVADGGMDTITLGRWNAIEKLVWLADGSGLLMNAFDARSSLLQIWLIDRKGRELRNITKDPSNYVGLSATRDSQVVLTTKKERTSSVWIQTLISNSLEQLPSSRYLGDYGIAWTADGKFVVASNIDGIYQIYSMEADGSNRKLVSFNDQNNLEPVISPDGRYIVFASYEGRHPHLWRVDADGNHAKQLTFGGDEDLPRFTPDGKWIVYHNIDHSRYSIRKVSIDAGEPVTLVSEHSTQPDVSPDGTLVACFAQRADGTVWEILVAPIDGGAPVARFPLPPEVDREWPGLRWSPDGGGLTYVATVQGVSNVWRQALSGGEAKPLTDFKENRIFFFDWSRERKLVLVRGTDTRDLILIRDFLNAKS